MEINLLSEAFCLVVVVVPELFMDALNSPQDCWPQMSSLSSCALITSPYLAAPSILIL